MTWAWRFTSASASGARTPRALVLLACLVTSLALPGVVCAQHTLWQREGFSRPTVALDATGAVYVANAGSNTVVKLSAAGDSLAAVGGSGWGTGQFDTPAGIACSGFFVFVADRGNHRIQRFATDLTPVSSLSTRETPGNASFGYPSGVCLSPEGDLFLSDGENRRVVKFNSFGQFQRSFGGIDGGGRFMVLEPTQVAATFDGFVFVLDRGRIASFDAFGNPHGWIATPDGVRGIAADGLKLYALMDGRISVVHPTTDTTSISLPAGAWRTVAVRGTRVVVGDEARIRMMTVE